MYKYLIKPSLDFMVSIILLVLFFPILLFLTIVLLFVNKGRVFYIHRRSGKNEKTFKLIKFKTIFGGTIRNHLEPISKESQNVINNNISVFPIGFQDDVRPFLAMSDIFVFPHRTEKVF